MISKKPGTNRFVSAFALLVGLVLATSASLFAGRARAQAASEPSAADRQAAGQAYDRASAAYLSRDYARAAPLFEMAYRLAPSSAALLQAVRSYERAGDAVKAGTLALRLQAFYPRERQAQREAERVLAAVREHAVRVDVSCAGTCTLELDGVLQEHTSFFATPDEAHVVRASFDTGASEQEARGAGGARVALTFEPPALSVATSTSTTATTTTTTTGPDDASSSDGGAAEGPAPSTSEGFRGISPIPLVVAGALTVISGGVLIWSGIDTLDGVPIYEAHPTEANLAVGQARELRTNVLIGVTSALAATSVILAALTDWSGGDGETPATDAPALSFSFGPDLAVLSLSGRY